MEHILVFWLCLKVTTSPCAFLTLGEGASGAFPNEAVCETAAKRLSSRFIDEFGAERIEFIGWSCIAKPQTESGRQ